MKCAHRVRAFTPHDVDHRLSARKCTTSADRRREDLSDSGESLDLTQTLSGRLRNFPLSPSPDNALWGVYEAVSNSLHAVRDTGRPTRQGRIDISVHRDAAGEVDGFTILDNGIGLNSDNFASFRKIDSTFKAVRGGKGVGRLTWLKIFDKVRVSSDFVDGEHITRRREFDFVENDERPIQNHIVSETSGPARTRIELSGMKPAYKRECPKRPDTILRAIIRHFLRDVISTESPSIVVSDDGTSDLRDVFASSIERKLDSKFSVQLGGSNRDFHITHLVVSKAFADHDANENVMYLLAHGRVVATQTVGGLIGLRKLQNGRTYVGLIEGSYLDEAVTQERTMLSTNSSIVDEIVRWAADEAISFLKEDTQPVRDRQLQMVKQIKREYPRFLGTLSSEKEFVDTKLPLSVRDQESVFRAVSLEWYRSKRRVDRSIRTGLSNPKNDDEFKKALADASQSIASESKAILADYVTERKVVIDFLSRLVARVRASADDDYETEARVHDLIAPRKSNSETIKLETHSLWLIDERLPYYYYFNSDLPLSQQIEGSDDLRRPDISLSDVASAFEQRGSNEPFIIVEFKRPGRDNYNSKDDPIKQCLDYVIEMRDGRKLTNSDGSWNSSIHENTLFYCYVIADITPTLRRLVEFHDMKKTPDGRGYFRFHEGLKAWCEVIPFDKLIESNRVRHNAFFEKLGIN